MNEKQQNKVHEAIVNLSKRKEVKDAVVAMLAAKCPDPRIVIDKIGAISAVGDVQKLSDGYHTFEELYMHRMVLTAAFFNMLAASTPYVVVKSKRHWDGSKCFDSDNWFIVQAELPTGQISYRYDSQYWHMFDIPEVMIGHKFDGHTPNDVLTRTQLAMPIMRHVDTADLMLGDLLMTKIDGEFKTCRVLSISKDNIYVRYYVNDEAHDTVLLAAECFAIPTTPFYVVRTTGLVPSNDRNFGTRLDEYKIAIACKSNGEAVVDIYDAEDKAILDNMRVQSLHEVQHLVRQAIGLSLQFSPELVQ